MITENKSNGSYPRHANLARQLAAVGRDLYARGWMLGTSGNLSAVSGADPLRLTITASGAHKGELIPAQILQIDALGTVTRGNGRPSDETRLHLTIVRERGAGAVLHTHSVWSTMLSEAFARDGKLQIEGFEMLKGLRGVSTHASCEELPVIENSEDMETLSSVFAEALEEYPAAHGVLLRRHGLYTWGSDLDEARRHVEILEFLLEVVGRTHFASAAQRTDNQR